MDGFQSVPKVAQRVAKGVIGCYSIGMEHKEHPMTPTQRNWLIDSYTQAMVSEEDREYLADAIDGLSDNELIELFDNELDESWRQGFTDTFGCSI